MKLPSSIRFVNEQLLQTLEHFQHGNAFEKDRYHRLKETFGKLEENVFSGIQIPKRLIPKYYIRKYRVTNLWKYNLPEGWRMLYWITRDGDIVVCTIIEWLNHKGYEHRFKY